METIDGVYSYLDFDSNLNYLTEPLLMITTSFNKRVSLWDNEYTCFIIPTDWASIPLLTRPIAGLSPRDKAIFKSAIGHDWLYKNQKITLYRFDKVKRLRGAKIKTITISRREADIFIYENMMCATSRQRGFTYVWLRIWGWKSWNDAKEILTIKETHGVSIQNK